MWIMSYQRGRLTTATLDVKAGSTVTKEHPLVAIDRWNKMYAREAERDRLRPVVCVLTWYAKLSEDEVWDLESKGLDLSAQDREINVSL